MAVQQREVTDEQGGQAFFARNATGLVRQVSPRSTFVWNLIPSFPPLVLSISVFWVLGTFTGANLYAAYWLTAAAAIVIAGAFGLVSSAMPRSAGDYVVVSRTLHPTLGLIASFFLTFGQTLSNAFIAVALATTGIGPALTVIGLTEHSTRLVHWGTVVETNNGWKLGIGLVAIGIAALAAAVGWHWALRFMNWLFALSMLGLAVAVIVLLATSRGGFIASFNHFAQPFTHGKDTYHSLIAAAHKAGITTKTDSSWTNTWPAVGAIMGFGVYNWFSLEIAGEVRRARTWTATLTMVAAAVITAVILTICTLVFFHTFGGDFFASANALNGTKAYPFAAPPVYFFFAAIAAGSPALAWFLGISFVAAFLIILYLGFVQPIRAFFAWSFDGLLPTRVAYVWRKTHMPAVALGLTVAITVLALLWAVYSVAFFTVLAYSVIFVNLAMLLVAISAAVLPFRRPAVWRGSASTRKVLGVPLTALAGILASVAICVPLFLYNYYDGLGAATHRGEAWRTVGIVAFAAVVFYVVAAAVRRRQGVRLSQTFDEIPPE